MLAGRNRASGTRLWEKEFVRRNVCGLFRAEDPRAADRFTAMQTKAAVQKTPQMGYGMLTGYIH